MPAEPFETGRVFHPRVDRRSQICVRTNRYSVPVRLIGRKVRVLLHSNEVIVFADKIEVARHERLIAKNGSRLELDHDQRRGGGRGSQGRPSRSAARRGRRVCRARGAARRPSSRAAR